MGERKKPQEGVERPVYQGYSICDNPGTDDPYNRMMEGHVIKGTYTGALPTKQLLDDLYNQAQAKVNEHLALHKRNRTPACEAVVGTPTLE